MAFRGDRSSLVGDLRVRNHILNTAEAEIHLSCTSRAATLELELRGRLTGPRCCYTTTVEVAYPLRPLPPRLVQPGSVAARVLIPEPSMWGPISPFLYEGPIEVVGSSGPLLAGYLSHGLRSQQLSTRGLRWNGRLLVIRGLVREQLLEAEALQFRGAGYNALLTSFTNAAAVAAAADRFGFLVLARLPSNSDPLQWPDSFEKHVSCLGYVLSQDMLEQEAVRLAALARLSGGGALLGAELRWAVLEDQLSGISFICCREELLPDLQQVQRPKLVLTEKDAPDITPAADILGWIRV